jgi:hypothetical protein
LKSALQSTPPLGEYLMVRKSRLVPFWMWPATTVLPAASTARLCLPTEALHAPGQASPSKKPLL